MDNLKTKDAAKALRWSVRWSVGLTTDRAVADAVGDAMSGTVWGAVHQAVAGVVEGIVEKTVFESEHPAPQDFLRVVGCDPMNNTKAYYAMSEAVYWAMGRAVDGAADVAVSDAVYWAVNEAVDLAMNRAVADAGREDPNHPALEDFLLEAEVPVGEP